MQFFHFFYYCCSFAFYFVLIFDNKVSSNKMSSNNDINNWETVTKSKKARNFEHKILNIAEKREKESQLPTLEEIMPPQQYQQFVNDIKDSEQNTAASISPLRKDKKKEKVMKLKRQKAEAKKSQKPHQQHHHIQLPNRPIKMETALQLLTAEDFKFQIEQLKVTYPGSELLWLKGMANYLNTALPFECDPIFSGKSIHYPSCLLTFFLKKQDVIAVLNGMVDANLEYFFHNLLLIMATDLSKNLTVFGYKLCLQLIGQNWPKICASNMAKTALLRNSYQNRANICLSILWAVGQGGIKELSTGIKVWQNLMLPQLEMRHYSKFVTDYIEIILKNGENQSLSLNQEEFFTSYDTLREAKKLHIAKEYQETLLKSCQKFLNIYIANCAKPANIFLRLLRNVHDENLNHIELDGCIQCLLKSNECYKIWRMNAKKQLAPSKILLQRICRHGNYGDLTNSADFKNIMFDITMIETGYKSQMNGKWSNRYFIDGFHDCKNGQEKASNQQKKKQTSESCKKHGKCCKWMFGSFLLFVLIGAALVYDTNVNGKGVFAKSAVGKALKDAGMLPYVEKAWYTTMGTSARAFKWAEENVPPYAKPALQLSVDLFKMARNMIYNMFGVLKGFAQQKLPVAAEFVEQYVPGLPKKIVDTSETVKNIFVDVFEKFVTFFKTQVLVGRLSPENLSIALNQTQNAAAQYYNLFHQKVDAYAKLK